MAGGLASGLADAGSIAQQQQALLLQQMQLAQMQAQLQQAMQAQAQLPQQGFVPMPTNLLPVCATSTAGSSGVGTQAQKAGFTHGESQQEHPAGSWVCSSCHNVNWPKRTSCNRCGQKRTGTEAEP